MVDDAAGNEFAVVLYYKYVRLGETAEEVAAVVKDQEALCSTLQLTGRVRIAKEGINGTLGGKHGDVQQYITEMKKIPFFQEIDWKTSTSKVTPFPELQVRVVNEIVAIELPDDQCSLANGGKHLTPEEFHVEQLNCSPDDYALIDVRNTYEYNIGHFEGAMNPKTRRFGQFPEWIQSQLPTLQKKEKILMYCTGGIRCEKASAYLKHLGLQNVYQLQGGIHRYLERYPDGGLFQGKNFVFDQRVSMSSTDSAVAGKCERCSVPYDVVAGSRCAYCRMHVLLCDACRDSTPIVYCDQHIHLIEGTEADLQAKAQELRALIEQEHGRTKKGKRRSLRKQLETMEARIQTLRITATAS